MAYVLRHNPTRYGLQPDRHGYVDFDAFFLIATRRYPDVSPQRLRALIEAGGAGRFELAEHRLRARYGHSIPVEPAGPSVEPPAQLYHGTDAARTDAILTEGLKPVDRRWLHLSGNVEEAWSVARRKTNQPVIWCILAHDAHRSGLAFYREGTIHLVAHVPASFLRLEPLPTPSIGGGHESEEHHAPDASR